MSAPTSSTSESSMMTPPATSKRSAPTLTTDANAKRVKLSLSEIRQKTETMPVPKQYLWRHDRAENCPVCRTAMKNYGWVIDPTAALTQAEDYKCPRCFIICRAVSLFKDKLEAGDVEDLTVWTDGPPIAFEVNESGDETASQEQRIEVKMSESGADIYITLLSPPNRRMQYIYEVFTTATEIVDKEVLRMIPYTGCPTALEILAKEVLRMGWRQRVIPYTGSTESFDYIAGLIERCEQTHPECAQVHDPPLPTRLLDIACPEGVQLVSPPRHATGRYCALSHCWGTSLTPVPKTTRATLASRQTQITESELSETFRNAITLSRHLSVRYIWIDSLCIIQDDVNDWKTESTKMASVYANAYLVIAATQAEHGDVGCFSNRFDDKSGSCKLEFGTTIHRELCSTLALNLAEESCVITFPVYIQPYARHKIFEAEISYESRMGENIGKADRKYPLLSRAWCLQERILATRVIHFNRDGLLWECRSEVSCECGELENWHPADGLMHRWGAPVDRPARLYDLWHTTLLLYTGTQKLTYETDRLPALSGLVEYLQARGCGRYVAGIWLDIALGDLCWYSVVSGQRPDVWRAPSWSWACADGLAVQFTLEDRWEADYPVHTQDMRWPEGEPLTPSGKPFGTKVVSVAYEPKDQEPIANITSASLTISAPMVELCLTYKVLPRQWTLSRTVGTDTRALEGDPNGFDGLILDCPTQDFGTFPIQSAPLLGVWVGTIRDDKYGPKYTRLRPQLLLLRPARDTVKGRVGSTAGSYERVGMLGRTGDYENNVRDETKAVLDWFKDAEVREITIV
jgi:hypothetical protein